MVNPCHESLNRRFLASQCNSLILPHSNRSSSSDFDSKRLQIFIVRNIGIHTLPDDLLTLLSVLLKPLHVFRFHRLCFLFLGET